MKQTCIHIFFTIVLSVPLLLHAQKKDTLPEVKVIGKEIINIDKTTIPVQQFNKKELAALNSVSVADAVKYFSGVLVKDYGGIGGLKTISIRSLGANHTGVMYDGIMTGDAQGGQVDLGRFSLDNIESIQLAVSQPVNILVPARSYASAAVLSLSSSTSHIEKRSLAIKLKGGSFGFFNPSLLIKSKPGQKISHAISAEYQRADGAYPYKNYVAGNADSKRMNADIRSYRAEYDVSCFISDTNKIKLKLYYYNAERGLPGAVTLYNNFSNERFDTEIFFSQMTWQKNISAKSRVLFSGKFSKDHKFYLDPSYPNSAGKLENSFHQQELYVSGAYSYKLSPYFSAAFSSDYFKSKLKRTDDFAQGFANPGRDNFLNNVAVAYENNRISANANLLYTALNENVENGNAARNLNELTPAVAVSYRLSGISPVRVRAFYKRIFRAPSFDDLYYTNFGNTDLKPEFVDQYNIGFTFNRQTGKTIDAIIITADAYYNNVKDKILAVPRQNLFQWTMLNIGKVTIKGIDATAFIKSKQWNNIAISSRLSYTFQQARDMSDPTSSLYNKQIPYTPEHSGAIGVALEYKNFIWNYNILFSSYRYRLGDQTPENLVKEWATQDISIGYNFKTKNNNTYRFTGELNNIFNKQYEIIKFYPMPRFNYRIGIIAMFNQS